MILSFSGPLGTHSGILVEHTNYRTGTDGKMKLDDLSKYLFVGPECRFF